MSPCHPTCRSGAATALLIFALLFAAVASAGPDEIFRAGFDQASTPSASVWTFSNVTNHSLDSIHDSDYRFDAIWTDFNNDGCYDIFIFGHADETTSRLWLNRCDGSHTFTYADNSAVHYYIPQPSTPRGSGWATLIDFNGDGSQDFALRDSGELGAIYINATTPGAHVPYFSNKQGGCIHGCAFADINGDNRIDLIHNDRLVNDGAGGQTIDPGISRTNTHIPMDVDGDGWTDLLEPNAGGYWHNVQGQLQWRSAALSGDPMQYVVADFNNDGRLDLFTFDGSAEVNGGAHLYRNDGHGSFTDVTAGSGLSALQFNPYWTNYGNTVAADFNNDGLPDLLVAGATREPSVTLLRNLGNMHFALSDANLGAAGGGSDAFKSRASVADFDNDGRLDVVKTQDTTNAGVWRNTTNTLGAHWMNVRVRGAGRNSGGIGTDLTWYRAGTHTIVAHIWVQANEQHPQTSPHAGLGANSQVDLVVKYPSGGPTRRFNNLTANQEVVVYPNGCIIQHWQPGNGWPLTAPSGCQ